LNQTKGMELINKNIKYLRQHKNMTQQAFADWLGITRSSVGAYEEGRAKPNFQVLQTLSAHFKLSLDRLLQEDLAGLTEQKVLTDKPQALSERRQQREEPAYSVHYG